MSDGQRTLEGGKAHKKESTRRTRMGWRDKAFFQGECGCTRVGGVGGDHPLTESSREGGTKKCPTRG